MDTSLMPARSGSGPAFAQTGQLDWVALSRSSVAFSLEVLARLANAGIEIITIGMGKAICSSIVLHPEAEQRLFDALSSLKSFSPYGRILWFGFGVKHIINSLSDTEQGATCVALCAALAVPYSSFYAAQVLKDLCILRGAPQDLTPSLRQWSALVEVCAGALTSSQFGNHFDGFGRLLSPGYKPQLPANPQTIAKCLNILFDLSKNLSVNATFLGGIECAWLATVAQWLLCLKIEILDGSGSPLYRSSSIAPGEPAHVVFIREEKNHASAVRILHRSYLVASGTELLHSHYNSETLISSTVRGPAQWSTILTDAFGPIVQEFLKPPISTQFGNLLRGISQLSEQFYSVPGCLFSDQVTSNDNAWWLYDNDFVRLDHPRRTGQEFLRFAKDLLPELKNCIDNDKEEDNSAETLCSVSFCNDCIHKLGRACQCHFCRGLSGYGRTVCFKSLAWTIIRFLLILSPVTIDEQIRPSPMSLRQLCISSFEPGKNEPQNLRGQLPCSGLPLVLFLLTGRIVSRKEGSASISAVSGNGVCVFYHGLAEIDAPPAEVLAVHAIPGHIGYREHIYKFITDAHSKESDSGEHYIRYTDASTTGSTAGSVKVELVVEEVENTDMLGAAYRAVPLIQGIAEYPRIWINIKALEICLRRLIRTTGYHVRDCSASFKTTKSDSVWSICVSSLDKAVDTTSPSGDENMHQLQWSIVTWKSHGTKKRQWFDIDVFQDDYIKIYEVLSSPKGGHLVPKEDRSCAFLSQIGKCPNCVVRMAATAWSEADLLPRQRPSGSPHSIPKFTRAAKSGVVNFYSSNVKESQTEFELKLVESDSQLTKIAKRLLS